MDEIGDQFFTWETVGSLVLFGIATAVLWRVFGKDSWKEKPILGLVFAEVLVLTYAIIALLSQPGEEDITLIMWAQHIFVAFMNGIVVFTEALGGSEALDRFRKRKINRQSISDLTTSSTNISKAD